MHVESLCLAASGIPGGPLAPDPAKSMAVARADLAITVVVYGAGVVIMSILAVRLWEKFPVLARAAFIVAIGFDLLQILRSGRHFLAVRAAYAVARPRAMSPALPSAAADHLVMTAWAVALVIYLLIAWAGLGLFADKRRRIGRVGRVAAAGLALLSGAQTLWFAWLIFALARREPPRSEGLEAVIASANFGMLAWVGFLIAVYRRKSFGWAWRLAGVAMLLFGVLLFLGSLSR